MPSVVATLEREVGQGVEKLVQELIRIFLILQPKVALYQRVAIVFWKVSFADTNEIVQLWAPRRQMVCIPLPLHSQ